MRSFWFGKGLPSEFNDSLVLNHLSFNGQLHFSCRSCNEIIWGDVTFAKHMLKSGIGFPCPNCRNQNLEIIRFTATESRLCKICGTHFFARPEEDFKCDICNSTQFVIDEMVISPPYPSQIYVLYGYDAPLGLSPKKDTEFLIEYVRLLRMSPQFHKTCVHFVAFIESIFEHIYGFSEDALDLLNIASGFMRNVYRETGDLDAAFLSIQIMIEGRNLAINPIQRAVFGFNICQ